MKKLNLRDSVLQARLLWVFVVVVAALCSLSFLDYGFSMLKGMDNYHYVLLAKALAEGAGYTDIHLPGHPPHTRYPPLFPVLLSLPFYFFGYNFVAMKFLVFIMAIASIFVVRKYYEKSEGGTFASVMALLVGTNLYFLLLSQELMTEVPYLFLSLLSLLFAERCIDGEGEPRLLLIFSLVVALACLTRSAGVILYAACLIALALRLKPWYGGSTPVTVKRFVTFAALATAPFFLWTLTGLSVGDTSSSYLSIFMQQDSGDAAAGAVGAAAILERVGVNVGIYLHQFSSPFTYDLFSAYEGVPVLLSAVFASIVLVGVVHKLKERRGAAEFYILLYGAVLLVWPTLGAGDAVRYLVPLTPLLYYYFLKGAALSFSFLGLKILRREVGPRRITAVACLFFLVINVFAISRSDLPGSFVSRLSGSVGLLSRELFKNVETVSLESTGAPFFESRSYCYHKYLKAVYHVGALTGPGMVLMTREPEMAALFSGSRAVGFPYTKDLARIREHFMESGVNIVVLDSCYTQTRYFLQPYLEAYLSEFDVLVDSDDDPSILLFRAPLAGDRVPESLPR